MDLTIRPKQPPVYVCPVHGDRPDPWCCAGKARSAEARRVAETVADRKRRLAEVNRAAR